MLQRILKNTVCFIYLLSSIISFAETPDQTPARNHFYSEKAYYIFEELCALVENNRNTGKHLLECIALVKSKLENRELLLLVNDEEITNVLFGASFTYTRENPAAPPYISLNENLLALYPRQKSIIFSILVHEIKHAQNYFANHDHFTTTWNNLLERYLYEMDAYHLEALVIKEVLVPNNFPLTEFEQFLLYSFEHDNLDYFSYTFKSVDMRLVYYMYDISRDNSSSALNIKELIRLGNDLITAFKFPEQKDDWERYESLVPLNSFLRFVPQIVYNIFIIKDNLKMEPDKFVLAEQAKEIYDIALRMSELFAPHSDFFASYSNGLLEHFGCSLLTAEDVFQEITHYEYEIFCNKIWNYLHIVPGNEITQGGAVTSNTQIGQVLKKPQLFSDKNQGLILEALALYDAERYDQAARLLEKAYKNEPDNPDVLYYYARTLYRFNGKKSFAVYLQLIKILDAQPGEKNCVKITTDTSTFEQIADPELKRDIIAVQQEMGIFNNANIFIDLWYVEAYWKMGTLYLDRQDYLHGAYEITRALIGGIGDLKSIREQAYQYLTEAYFYLKKYALARYCAEKTLEINPRNKYIDKFLDEMEKIRSKNLQK